MDVFFAQERFCVKNKPICVLSSLAPESIVKKNGIYDLDGDRVKNIYYMPGEQTFNKIKSQNGLYNFVTSSKLLLFKFFVLIKIVKR
jgi:hypothetical protein